MDPLIISLLHPNDSLGYETFFTDTLRFLKINIPDPANLEDDITTVYSIIKKHNDYDVIVFASATEIFDYEYMKMLTHNAHYVNNFKHILFYDNGYNSSNPITEWGPINVHHIQNTVTKLIVRTLDRQKYNANEHIIKDKNKVIGPDYVYYIDNMLTSQERNIKFVCLNKAPRVHRVRLVEEIVHRNLHNQGIVSCGYDSIKFDYSKICLHKLQHLFPLQVETTERITDDNDVNQSLSTFNEESFITVVAETSCEQVDHPLMRGGFGKIFITEKTLKAFITGTFPLILAPKHAIQHLRDRGFDMFDDIIDHSYDNCADPNIKVKMIVDQLENLLKLDIEDLRALHITHKGRLDANRMNTIHYTKDILDKKYPHLQQYISNIT